MKIIVWRCLTMYAFFLILSDGCIAQTLSNITNFFLASFAEHDQDWRTSLLQREQWYDAQHEFVRLYQDLLKRMLGQIGTSDDLSVSDKITPSDGASSVASDVELGEWLVENVLIPSEALVAVIGDIFGDLHAFLRILWVLAINGWITNDFVLKKRAFIVFTGNYVGREPYGIEVWYLLLCLKYHNPDQVFIIKGVQELSPEQQERFGGACDGFPYRLQDEVAKTEALADEESIAAYILDYSRRLPIGLLCSIQRSDHNISCGAFISSSGVPLLPGVDNFVLRFSGGSGRNLVSLPVDQAWCCLNPRFFDAREAVEQATAWVAEMIEPLGRPLMELVIGGGAYRQHEAHVTFTRADAAGGLLLPTISSTMHTAANQYFTFRAHHSRYYPVLQVSSVVPMSQTTKHEAVTIWSPFDNSIQSTLHVRTDVGGYGRFVQRGASPGAFSYVCGAEPAHRVVPSRLQALLGGRSFIVDSYKQDLSGDDQTTVFDGWQFVY